MDLDTQTVGGKAVVSVSGELDAEAAPALREKLVDLINQGTVDTVLDLGGVDFLDSAGLTVIVNGTKRAKAAGGSLRVVCTSERVLKVFRITGTTKTVTIYPSVDEATEAG